MRCPEKGLIIPCSSLSVIALCRFESCWRSKRCLACHSAASILVYKSGTEFMVNEIQEKARLFKWSTFSFRKCSYFCQTLLHECFKSLQKESIRGLPQLALVESEHTDSDLTMKWLAKLMFWMQGRLSGLSREYEYKLCSTSYNSGLKLPSKGQVAELESSDCGNFSSPSISAVRTRFALVRTNILTDHYGTHSNEDKKEDISDLRILTYEYF